ncbi:MAG: D-glycero-beta-D-manno-heptose 1-phosphate adenylyltransferase [Candidatus Omnitrophica bacterium]|nr:D-glycero-beta-D-manno-heptose 1-phosphate adenylyltransferase [Candidatus Omnitrophota bacterium]
MFRRKLKSKAKLLTIIKNLKKLGKKIVFTNGCFDLLHYGHAKYLEDARRLGDILIVGVNTDTSVKRLKGERRPIIEERYRALLVAALESVDYVVLFKEDTPESLIRSLRPDVLVKGADWQTKDIVGARFVQSYGGKVVRIKLVKGFSTTAIIKKILNG